MVGGYYDTDRIRGRNGERCFLCCSFQKKHYMTSFRWNLHKGRLCSDMSDFEKVIVKVCPEPDKSDRECQAAVKKLDLAELVVRQSPDLRKLFVVADTYEAMVAQKDSIFSCMSLSDKKKKQKTVRDGTTVVVQERHDGQIQNFLDLEEEKTPCWQPGSRSPFHELFLASYRVSGGRYLISSVKGVNLDRCNLRKNDDKGYGSAKFLITSLTVQSADKEFGTRDNGMDGIKTFLKSADSFVPRDLLDAGDFAQKLRAKREPKEKPRITLSSVNSSDSSVSSSCNCSDHGCHGASKDNDTVKESDALLGLFSLVLNPPEPPRPFSDSRYMYYEDYDH